MVDVVSDQTEVDYAETTTQWSGDSFVLETEILVQDTNSVAVIQTTNGANDVIVTKASGTWDMSGSHIRVYINSNISANMDTEANGGLEIRVGDGTNTAVWTVGGKDTYAGGWKDFFVDVDSTPTSGSVDSTIVDTVTFRINTTTKPRNATNGWYDNWRFGNGLEINSTTTEAISFTDVATEDALTANQYDILQDTDGVLFCKGKLTLGNAAAAKNSNLVSLNETIFFIDEVVSSTLYGIVGTEGTGATDIDITGLVCKTVGTSGAELDFSSALTSFALDGCTFIDMGTMTFNTGTVDNTKFNGCGTTSVAATQTFTGDTWILSDQITLNNGGKLIDCTVDRSINASAILTDDLSDLTTNNFIGDSTGHAVEISSVAASPMTWNNTFDTTTYATVDGSTGNEVIFVNVGSGSLTINVTDGATTPTVRTAGATVTVVAGSVTLAVNASETDGTGIQNARVLLKASNGTGPFPFEETVTISNSGTTATVTHTAHGMDTNDYAQIRGGSLSANEGVFQITVTGVNAYTYTMGSTPGSSPTGTIEATFVALYGLTDANGDLSTSRVYASAQPVVGWTRKSTSTPFFKEGILTGSISATAGYTSTAVMISDE